LALHTRNERMVFHIMLTVLGEIEPEKLDHAISVAMHAHPTMRSILRVRSFRCCREERGDFGENILTVRDCGCRHVGKAFIQRDSLVDQNGEIDQWINQPLEPEDSTPVRVLLLRHTLDECILVFTFHHSAADGLRAVRFIKEVVDTYGGEGTAELPHEEDTCSCHRREEVLSLMETTRRRTKHFYLNLLRNLYDRFIVLPLSPPARLVHDRFERPSGEISFVCRRLNPSQLNRLTSGARESGATPNDVLLAGCFRTVEKWNQLHGRTCNKISVMMPVDVGRRSSMNVISNQVSFISPFTTRKDRADPASLLQKTARARANLLKNGSLVSIIYFTYFISFLPLPLLRAVARLFLLTGVHVDSILLTNLGSIWSRPETDGARASLGKAAISEVSCIAPVITPFRMSLLASTYNGALNISLSYRTCLVSGGKARAFLDMYFGELLSDENVDAATMGTFTVAGG